MITAEKARKMYEKQFPRVVKRKINEELRYIKRRIKNAIKDGKNTVEISHFSHEGTIAELMNYGFRVNKKGYIYEIVW